MTMKQSSRIMIDALQDYKGRNVHAQPSPTDVVKRKRKYTFKRCQMGRPKLLPPLHPHTVPRFHL